MATTLDHVLVAQRLARQASETLSFVDNTSALINRSALELASAQLHEATRIVDSIALAGNEGKS